MARYIVRVERQIQQAAADASWPRQGEPGVQSYDLGPYRLRLVAAVVAWVKTTDNAGGFSQRATVVPAERAE